MLNFTAPLPHWTAEQARRNNSVYYFTGSPCKHGHLSWRRTKCGSCYQCSLDRQRANKPHASSRYGITPIQYQELLTQQKHTCAICQTDLRLLPTHDVHIDHNHTTGNVRGILCRGCNQGLGMFHDNQVALASAIAYLNQQG